MCVVEQSLLIIDGDRVLAVDYDGALAAHAGESWFGVAVGYRMLQVAGEALSVHRLWNRKHLFVASGHPGDGVRDVVEYVTRCVSSGQYRVEGVNTKNGCGIGMRFAWEVSDGSSSVSVSLRDNFVPQEFYELLDRLGTTNERPSDASRFDTLKRRLAEQVWLEPLPQLFSNEVLKME